MNNGSRVATRLVVTFVLLLGLAAHASADAIGGPCPAGQIYETNPVPPGAMHHGGGRCVPDPHASASTCSAHPGASAPPWLLVVGIALLVGRKRRRDKVSRA